MTASQTTSRITAAAVLLALAVAACVGGTGAAPQAPGPSATEVPVATESPATPTPSPLVASMEPPTAIPGTRDAVPGAYLQAAIADAASRAGVDPADVTVISTESRDWPSGALGCPVMGFMYTDMVTPGYRIVVEAGGTTYDYRAASRGAGDVRLCENPLGPNPQGSG
jgi:hypothetical protein